MIRGILFDVDGTLVSSNDAHARAFVDAFRAYGLDVSYDSVRTKIGMGGDKLIPAIVGDYLDEELIDKIGKTKNFIYKKKYLPEVEAYPKVPELLTKLGALDICRIIVTSAGKEEVLDTLKQAQIEDKFDLFITASDVENSKPDPDLICEAIKKSGIPPIELVMLGDTPYDVEAATRAGVKCIGFQSGGWDADDLKGTIVTYVGIWDFYEQLETVLRHTLR